jgi:hypothetical protein
MSTKRGIAAAAFMAVFLMVSAPAAFGQVVDSTEVDTLMEEIEPAEDQTPGQAIDALNYANVVWAVENTGAGMEEFSAVTDPAADRIHIIDVGTLVTEGDQMGFDEALAASELERGELHAFIGDSDLLELAFEENNVDHETAVGIDVLDDGNVVIFYHDPEASP